MTTPQSKVNKLIEKLVWDIAEEASSLIDGAGTTLGVQEVARKALTTLEAAARAEERERFPTTMPRSVSITIVANDGVEQEAIRKVLTLEQISRSSGAALKLVTEDAIRAIVQSKIITQNIATPTNPPNN